MIITTWGVLLVFILRMVYGQLAEHYFESLRGGILYADLVMGLIAGVYVLYLLSVLFRAGRGDRAPGLIRCAIALVPLIAFFLAVELMKNSFSFLRKYELTVILGFAVYALFYVVLVIVKLVRLRRDKAQARALKGE